MQVTEEARGDGQAGPNSLLRFATQSFSLLPGWISLSRVLRFPPVSSIHDLEMKKTLLLFFEYYSNVSLLQNGLLVK